MTLKLNGSSSGSVSIDAPASTDGGAARTLTLPDDASNGVIKTSTYPSSIQVLEQFFTPCDGSVIATNKGNVTVGDVNAAQTSGAEGPGSGRVGETGPGGPHGGNGDAIRATMAQAGNVNISATGEIRGDQEYSVAPGTIT